MTLDTTEMRELSADEVLAVSGAKKKTATTKKVICTTVIYDDGSSVRTCVPDKK
ncbi:MAG: hypothetical protein M5U07_21910 [Xanthobacteraceae bacterium]|nr:hypothetical protein [Xanthobacteraceae bacterium]